MANGAYVVNQGPSVEGFLLPAFAPDGGFFWEGTAAGELRIQKCNACGRLRHPPRVMCPACRSTDRGYAVMSGQGTIWSYVVPHPPLLSPYSDLAPYNVVVVELDEDPRLRFVGNLVSGPDSALNSVDPYSIRIGEPVEVLYRSFTRADGSEVSLPFWVRP
ncbi:MAG: Zn-ribbon domain-containing OB-fold protein [Acidimicrobiales bacterium]